MRERSPEVLDDEERALRPWGSPAYVVAIARDREARRVTGVPVEWTLERGELAFDRQLPGRLGINDICTEQPIKPRDEKARIRARVGELEASIELEWTALPSDGRDTGNEACEAKGCATVDPSKGQGPHALLGLLGLLALGRVRARRALARQG